MIFKKILEDIIAKGVNRVPLSELIIESTERNKESLFSDIRSVSAHYGLISTNDFFDNSPASKDTKAYKVVRPQMFAYNPARINIGSIAFSTLKEPVVVSPMYIVFSIDTKRLNPQYLLYWLKSQRGMHEISSRVEVGARFRLPLSSLKRILIPLPPLDVQNQIMEKLGLIYQLVTKLDEEISLRKKQYEYCLDYFFGATISEAEKKVNSGMSLKSLDEIGKLTRGKRFVREDIVEHGTPCIHYGDMYMTYGVCENKTKTFLTEEKVQNLRFASKGDVVIVGAGENDWDIGVGLAWYGDEETAVHDACYIYKHKQNSKYISYFLRSNNYHLQIRGSVSTGKICAISAKDLGKAKILIPKDIKEQNAIVEKLDAFTSLISKLEEERDLRQKQYEYYREKLLTFE